MYFTSQTLVFTSSHKFEFNQIFTNSCYKPAAYNGINVEFNFFQVGLHMCTLQLLVGK